ncbi:hypothetical protein EKD04_012895 [Chloroflexales bacterium ZM16-3]|nr:hypothetical protein [Chloroflexales bacterium ZM16-3]
MNDFIKNSYKWIYKNPGKALLLCAGFTSSSFVGFWMITTMPATIPFWFGSIMSVFSAVVLDGIITYTAFSKNQGAWNWLTVVTALVGSVFATLALFGGFHWFWLHVIFTFMTFLFSRFLASEHTGTSLIKLDTPEDKDKLITKLIAKGMNNSDVFDIVGGDRTKTWKRINELRAEDSAS